MREADFPNGMPYFAEHLKAFPPATSLGHISKMFRMHPLLVCECTSLLDDAIRMHGAAAVKSVMDDKNHETHMGLQMWFTHFGSRFPPSPCNLVREVFRRTRLPDPENDSPGPEGSEERSPAKRRRVPSSVSISSGSSSESEAH